MSEILQEIEKELRRERWLGLWQTHRTQAIYGIGVFVAAAVVLSGLWFYNAQRTEAASEVFNVALTLKGKNQLAAFAELTEEFGGIYGALADFQQAGLLAQQGRWQKANKIYSTLAEEGALTEPLRDLARLYGAQIILGRYSYLDVERKLGPALAKGRVFRYKATEILALAALDNKNPIKARELLEPMLEDNKVPPTLAARAQILLNKIAASSRQRATETIKAK